MGFIRSCSVPKHLVGGFSRRSPFIRGTHPCFSSSSSSTPSDEWKSDEAVLTYAKQGPLYEKCFSSGGCHSPPSKEWIYKGQFLRQELGTSGHSSTLTSQAASRVFHLYLPLYFWLRWLVRGGARGKTNKAAVSPSPASSTALSVGLHAPQGAGKTTLFHFLEGLFKMDKMSCVVLSIDDFYLTNKEQKEVAATNPHNKLLQFRGNAGTHDIALGSETISKGKTAQAGNKVKIPSYDKSLCQGSGDRVSADQWREVEGPIDVILLEGWMLGFESLSEDDPLLLGQEPGLKDINQRLSLYDAWHRQMDAWVIVEIPDTQVVASWRLEAEQHMREKKGKEGSMTDEQVLDFVSRFMPAYKAYLPALYAKENFHNLPTLHFVIDAKRQVIA